MDGLESLKANSPSESSILQVPLSNLSYEAADVQILVSPFNLNSSLLEYLVHLYSILHELNHTDIHTR